MSEIPFNFDDIKRLRKRNKYGALVKTGEYRQKLHEWYEWLEEQRMLDRQRNPYPKFYKEVTKTWKEIYK